MNKKQILETIDIGSRVAEDEQKKLKKYFIKTHAFKELDEDKVDILYGPKGTGKSAIYLHMIENKKYYENKRIKIIQAENIRGDTAFRSVIIDPPTDESTFKNIWKLYFIILIFNSISRTNIINKDYRTLAKILRQTNLLSKEKSLVEYFSDSYSYIKRQGLQSVEAGVDVDLITGLPTGFKGKISFENTASDVNHLSNYNISTLFELANRIICKNKKTFWICLDRLDTVFEESENLEENAIRGLFKTYLDTGAFLNIKIKIFLRTDIWNKITKRGFREASHITRFTTIQWSEENILNMLIRRFIENECICAYYETDKDKVLNDFALQYDLFYKIFPKTIEKGSNKSETIRWIISHTWDGTNTITPREIIHLILELRRLQINNFNIGKDQTELNELFDRGIFKDALIDVSRVRMEQTIFAEYNSQKAKILSLLKHKATNPPDIIAQYLGVELPAGQKEIDDLIEIGILRPIKYKNLQYYEIPFIYRPYLNSIQGRSDL